MILQISFIRHGESEGNREGLLQGQTNYNLTLQGRNQAIITSNFLERKNWFLICSSDLIRANEVNRISSFFFYNLIPFFFLSFSVTKIDR